MRSLLPLRSALGLMTALHVYTAYVLLFRPTAFLARYGLTLGDTVQVFLMQMAGIAACVFACMSGLALLRPQTYRHMIILLTLLYFLLFIRDVVALARGVFVWSTLLPEMLIFVLGCIALIRWYPSAWRKELSTITEGQPSDDLDADVSEQPQVDEPEEGAE